MHLSVIISTYNAVGPLRECLVTLKSELNRADNLTAEVIVADGGSTDGTSSMLSREFPGVKLVRGPSEEYFVQSINRGYAESSGDYILTLQSDIQVVEGSVIRLLAFMDSSARTAACSCMLFSSSTAKLEPTCAHFLSLTSELFEWTRIGWLFPNIKRRVRNARYMKSSWNRLDTIEVDVTVANFMLFRKEAIEDVRGGKPLFDNRFTMFFAEDELCWRLRKAGWKIYHIGDNYAYHIGRFSMSKMNSGYLDRLCLQDRLIYHAIVLGPIRSLIFRGAYRTDCALTSILKSCGVIQ